MNIEKMTPKKKEKSSLFFRLKIKLEGISNNQEDGILSIPLFSGAQTIFGKDKIISTYDNLGKQLQDFIENNFNHEFFSKKFNPHNFIV